MWLIPFIALTTIGCALRAAAFITTGAIVGSAWATVSSKLGRALLVLGLVAVVLSVMRSRQGG